MDPARAIADYRQAILRELDRRIAELKNRTNYGFVALQEFKLWMLARGEKGKEGAE